jgi:predicted N-formylglutamate amidohydrolase
LNEFRTNPAAAGNLLLGPDDPAPVQVLDEGGASPLLLLGDHAGRAIPGRLGGLGLAAEAMDGHIAWDIGVAGLGARLSCALDACFVAQAYSRLVIDCNRRPGEEGSIPAVSDGVTIPGNLNLGADEIARRISEIYAPYQACIGRMIDQRARRGQPTILVSLHSFTPVLQGRARPWRYGVLHRGDSPVSARMLALLRLALGDEAGDNQPYALDAVDNTVPLHADPRGLDYLELEVRQDLMADPAGEEAVARFLGERLDVLAGEPGLLGLREAGRAADPGQR